MRHDAALLAPNDVGNTPTYTYEIWLRQTPNIFYFSMALTRYRDNHFNFTQLIDIAYFFLTHLNRVKFNHAKIFHPQHQFKSGEGN